MSGKLNLALAVLAFREGNSEDCLQYLAKANGEFGDDLTNFVSEVMQPAPTAVRNDGSTPQAENTIAPSLASEASASDFVALSRRVSRQIATASYLEDGDELDEEYPDESLEDDLFLDDEPEGVDDDLDDEDDEDELEEEAVANAQQGVGPVRYKS